jgi:uncharacterized BrkB/YihY/UPF0761 family membrane protein
MGRLADLRAKSRQYALRGELMRADHSSVDAVYVLVDRDSEVGGGLISGALAYRLFIWLLPFVLVVVGGIGVASSASESPQETTHALGLTGVVSRSVAEASRGSSRWYALLIGIPILLWASRSLLKALIVAHRIVWGDLRRTAPKPTVGNTLRFLLFLVGYFAISELARWLGIWTGSTLVRIVAGTLLIMLWWLLISIQLPHGGAGWIGLLPGAVVVGAGIELLADVGVYFLVPRVESSQSTYGALGIAAGLLFGLFLISRIVVGGAVLNATLWERRTATEHAS